MVEETIGGKLEIILLELEKITELVKQPSQKRSSNPQVFSEVLMEWVASKPNHLLLEVLLQ
jgi:hypothetical protein